MSRCSTVLDIMEADWLGEIYRHCGR